MMDWEREAALKFQKFGAANLDLVSYATYEQKLGMLQREPSGFLDSGTRFATCMSMPHARRLDGRALHRPPRRVSPATRSPRRRGCLQPRPTAASQHAPLWQAHIAAVVPSPPPPTESSSTTSRPGSHARARPVESGNEARISVVLLLVGRGPRGYSQRWNVALLGRGYSSVV